MGGWFFGGFSFLGFFLGCLLLRDDLRDLNIGIWRVYVEVLREDHTRSRRISFWLNNLLWFRCLPSTCLNSGTRLKNLSLRTGKVLKYALLRWYLYNRLRFSLKSFIVKWVFGNCLYLREVRWLFITHLLLERSTEKIFWENWWREIVIRQFLTLLEFRRIQHLGFELSIKDFFFHNNSPQVFLELGIVKRPSQFLSDDLSRMIDSRRHLNLIMKCLLTDVLLETVKFFSKWLGKITLLLILLRDS